MKSIREAFDEVFSVLSASWIPAEDITQEYLDNAWKEFVDYKSDYLRDPCFPTLETLDRCMRTARVS